MQFYGISCQRGEKRILEQKKFKYLGQIQTLRSIFSRFLETKEDFEIISGEKLYSLIYMIVDDMYKCQITQKYLVDFIDINSKKRESKRAIDFMEGAKEVLNQLADQEITNSNSKKMQFANPFKDALAQVVEKLQHQKNIEHLNLVKFYNSQKIQLINYFICICKFKAMSKIHIWVRRSPETIKTLFNDQIRKLQLKLEQTDIQLTSMVQKHQLRKIVKQDYFRYLGQMSVVKCSIKGIEFTHIYDYMALNIIKMRTYESIWINDQMVEEREIRNLINKDQDGKTVEQVTTSKKTSSSKAGSSKRLDSQRVAIQYGKLDHSKMANLMKF